MDQGFDSSPVRSVTHKDPVGWPSVLHYSGCMHKRIESFDRIEPADPKQQRNVTVNTELSSRHGLRVAEALGVDGAHDKTKS